MLRKNRLTLNKTGQMTYKKLSFIGLSVLLLAITIIGVGLLTPEKNEEKILLRSEKSKRMNDIAGYPDLYAEHFAQIQGLDDGYAPYPHGYKMAELEKARAFAAKRGNNTILDWVERGPGNVGGRTRAILVDRRDPTNNTWFVGAVGGGVWKGRRGKDDFGHETVEWTPLTDHLPSLGVSAMAGASEKFPEVIYVGTGEGHFNADAVSGQGIFKTTDGGETWIHLKATNKIEWTYVNRIAVDPDNPDNVVVATQGPRTRFSFDNKIYNSSIFRSTDGGLTFSKSYSIPMTRGGKGRIQDLQAKPDDFNIQIASVNEIGILRSIDGGITWDNALENLVYPGRRIELAFSPSHPDVAWASVEGAISQARHTQCSRGHCGIDDLYRTEDAGKTWNLIEHLQSTSNDLKSYLLSQGWYDNTIAVHPFSPDTVFLGGVALSKAWIIGGRKDTLTINGIFGAHQSLMRHLPFESATHIGVLAVGPRINGATDIELGDLTSIEVRYGPNLKQYAHRYTIPDVRESGTKQEIPFSDYTYEDYIEVPFQVWDIDNNRQLMISFRDQAKDGLFNLIHENLDSGPINTHSREWLFISKREYAETPLQEHMTDGGFTNGLMFWLWPVLRDGHVWTPANPPEAKARIDVDKLGVYFRDMKSWNNGRVHVDHHNFTIIPVDSSKNEFIILNGNDGGFAYSFDSGKTWKEGDKFPGYNTAQFYDVGKRPGYSQYIGGTQDNGTQRSGNKSDSESLWEHTLPGDGIDVVWKSPDSVIASQQFMYIYNSSNAGARGTWNSILWDRANGWPGQFLTSIAWNPQSWSKPSQEAVFTLTPKGPGGGLLRSLDFGVHWDNVSVDQDAWNGGGNGKVRVSKADPNVVWAGYRMRRPNYPTALHVFENALDPDIDNVTVQRVNSPEFVPVNIIGGLNTHPFERETAYVTFAVSCEPKVVRTQNMGRTWEDLSGYAETEGCTSNNGFPNVRVYDLLVFPDIPWVMWAGTDIGIVESRDHGKTWSYADNGLPAVSVWRMKIRDDEVILATHGRGIWSLDIGQVQTSVEESLAEVPASFELLDNYPNPFNPSTTIGFNVSDHSNIRITVYDVLGRKVSTLTDQPYASGSHKITWDASAMSSGQYFYRMEANGKLVGAKPMMLIK